MTPRIVRTVADLRSTVAGWRAAGARVGLVPTMGALHEGHLSLVRAARAACRHTVVSIFVNPTQFGPNADFDRYPRDLDGDLAKLATVGSDLVFAPDAAEMYPQGFATTVTVAGLTDGLCGPHRPGHFAGVATVVTKLLTQTAPDAAFFGEKDFQQLQIIRRLVRDLNLPVEIVGVPTVREADGLAMSSRNLYLSAEERTRAATIYRVLNDVVHALASGDAAADAVARGKAQLASAGFDPIEYLEVVDAETLKPVPRATGTTRVALAAWLGKTRLIDNMAV
ncbi:MAG TPA: pantoate--beta-alanine ligase [Alphaproteobacteria bacterium]|nr:pantoate--beta-alanine ligase [Alphaproteobacteria bacterium]